MASTIIFKDWLTEADLDNHGEIYGLYEVVRTNTNDGIFDCDYNGSVHVVTYKGIRTSLILVSEKAKQAFLREIEDRYCDGIDIESWYGFECAIRN